MKRKSRGQTLVEFALVFPLIMFFLFATIDFGYYVYGWSQVQFGARRGAEQASIMQPRDIVNGGNYSAITNDPCLRRIQEEVRRSGGFNTTTTIQNNEIFIEFYNDAAANDAATSATGDLAKAVGKIVEVRIRQTLKPLTPVGQTFAGSNYEFLTISRRTILSNGPSFTSADGPNYVTCED